MTIAALSLLWPAPAYAKRKAPTPVPAVVWQGVEYRAPLDVEHMGRVQAFDPIIRSQALGDEGLPRLDQPSA